VGDRELAVIPQPESALYCVKRAGRGFACGTRGYGIVPRSAPPGKLHGTKPTLWGRTSRSSGPLACMVKIVRCSANRSRTRALQTHPPTLWAIHREPEPPRPDGTPRCALTRRRRGELGKTTRVGNCSPTRINARGLITERAWRRSWPQSVPPARLAPRPARIRRCGSRRRC
jgi:hypothetical protein